MRECQEKSAQSLTSILRLRELRCSLFSHWDFAFLLMVSNISRTYEWSITFFLPFLQASKYLSYDQSRNLCSWFQIFQRVMIIHLKFAFLLMVVLPKSHTRSLPLTRIRRSSVMHRQPLVSSFWPKPAIEGEPSTPIFSLIMTWREQMKFWWSLFLALKTRLFNYDP